VVGGGGATMGATARGDQVEKKVPFLSLACVGGCFMTVQLNIGQTLSARVKHN